MLHPIEKPKFNQPQNDDKFRADVVDSSNKENIPPLAYSNERHKFAPTMVNVREEFDKKYKLPRVKKPNLKTQEKIETRNKKKRN